MVVGTKTGPRYVGRRVTREEYLDLEEDGFLYDMIEGVLFLSPSGTFFHGESTSRFTWFLARYLDKHPVGRIATEVDILLPDGGDVLRPDLSFILNEHMNIVIKHIHGAPDLVCEILSESTADRDLGVKSDRYQKNGVREFWIVDPLNHRVHLRVNRPGGWEERTGETIASELLPGFVIVTGEFFPPS